jgi:hypothetical protein
MSNGEAEPRYFIALNWYEENERSFTLLVQGRLCPSCCERYATEVGVEVFTAFRDCCSKREGFFSPNLPLLELIFRLFLANGNQPLTLQQISEQLKQWLSRSGDTRNVSVPVLKRLVDNDRYYGFRPFPEGEP